MNNAPSPESGRQEMDPFIVLKRQVIGLVREKLTAEKQETMSGRNPNRSSEAVETELRKLIDTNPKYKDKLEDEELKALEYYGKELYR